ncbi:hypothetical protein CCACVL1_09406, partial [Corchorus capsularis]
SAAINSNGVKLKTITVSQQSLKTSIFTTKFLSSNLQFQYGGDDEESRLAWK